LKIRGHRLALVLLGAGLLLLQGIGLFLQTKASFDGVIAIALSEGVVYLTAVYCVARIPTGRCTLVFILLVAALLRIGTVVFPPYLSSDVYRYVWDGRVQGAGINPYRYIPSDDTLMPLRDEAIYPHINRANYAMTIYPPAAQIIYFAVTRISEGITAMKLAMLAFDLATIGLLVLLLQALSAPPDRVLIYAWHPLTLWEIAGSGHVDAVVIAFLAFALLARQRNMPALTGVAVALGSLVKFFPLAIAPAVYRRWDWRMPAALVATAVGLYLPYLSAGRQVFGFLPTYLSEERLTTGAGFYILSLLSFIIGNVLPTGPYLVAAVLILGGVALFVSFHRWKADHGYLFGSLILATVFFVLVTPHYPWYFLWLLPLLCLVPYWPALFLTIASFILYAALEDRSPAQEFLVNSLLYGSFLLAALIHLCIHRWYPLAVTRVKS
jgi:alpha-1,6-mannosyltransferase